MAGLIVFALVVLGCRASREATTPSSQATRPAPEFLLEPASVDLGRVGVGTTRPFRTTVRNLTTRSLDFLGFESGCGCSKLRVTLRDLPPKHATEMEGEFVAPTTPGPFRKEIKVRWGSAERPASFVLTGEIYPEVVLTPDTVVLRPDPFTAKRAEVPVKIENRSGQAVQVRLEGVPPGVVVGTDPLSLAAGQSGTLTLACDPWFLTAESLMLYAVTTHPYEKRIKLPLLIDPANALHLRPKGFRWGVVARQDLRRLSPLQLTLTGAGLEQFAVQNVEAPPFLQCTGKHAAAGQMTLDFIVVNSGLTADLNGEIVIHLRPKTEPRTVTLKVSTSGILRDP